MKTEKEETEKLKKRRLFKITLGDLKGLNEIGYLSKKGKEYLKDFEGSLMYCELQTALKEDLK